MILLDGAFSCRKGKDRGVWKQVTCKIKNGSKSVTMSHFQSIVQPRKEIGVVCDRHMQFRSLVTNVWDAMVAVLPERVLCAPE